MRKAVPVHPWPSPMFAFEVLVLKYSDTHTRTYKQANLARLTCFFNKASGRNSCGFQNFFHTFTWNVVNNKVFHGQNPLIRPRKHNNTPEVVNCKPPGISPASSGPRNGQVEAMFSHHRQKAQGFGILIFGQVKNWYLCSDVWGDIFKKSLTFNRKLLVIFRASQNYVKNSILFGALLFCPAWSQTILHGKHLPDELVFRLGKSERPWFWHGHQS